MVLPQLGKNSEHVYPRNGLRDAVTKWLYQFEDEEPVICFDFVGDWGLLFDLLDRNVPDFIQSRNVLANIDDLQFEHYMLTLFDGAAHHALHDAICNMLAFRDGELR